MDRGKIKLGIIGLIVLIGIFSCFVNAQGGEIEISQHGRKIANNNGIILSANNIEWCDWKPDSVDDGYKICNSIIEVNNTKKNHLNLNALSNKFNFDISNKNNVKDSNYTYYWSEEYEVYNETLQNKTCLEKCGKEVDCWDNCYYEVERRRWLNWNELTRQDKNKIDSGEVIAFKVQYEIPKYDSAHYNFTLKGKLEGSEFEAKIDPDISACGNLDVEGATYNLTQDLTTDSTCMIIDNSSITFNMMGYSISNSTVNQIAIEWTSGNNIIIKNGSLLNTRMKMDGGEHHRFEDILINNTDAWSEFSQFGLNNITIINLTAKNIEDDFTSEVMNNHTWYNSTLTGTDGSSEDGLIYSLGNGNNFYNINITVDFGAIFHYTDPSSDSYNNYFENSHLQSNGGTDGYVFVGINNLTFRDSTIRGTDYCGGVFYYNDDDLTFINTTAQNSSGGDTMCNENGITVKWYFSPQVNYTHNGTAVSGATVTGWNKTGDQQFTDTTDSNGRITTQELIEYVNVNEVRTYYSNYTINASLTGWGTDSQEINLTTNYLFQPFSLGSLGDTTPPTYSNAQANTTMAGALCNFSITYDDDTALEPGGSYIFSTNNTGIWVNESIVSFTSTPQSISVIKVLNDTVGLTIAYRWFANDSAGNNNNTPIYLLTTTGQTYTRSISQDFTTTSTTDRTGSLKRDTSQSFTISEVISGIGGFSRKLFQPLPFGRYEIPTDGLISWWTFDNEDINETTAFDVWGTNDGSREGNVTSVTGRIEEGFEFDGDGDYVSLPSTIFQQDWNSTGFTISIWINVKTFPQGNWEQDIIAQRYGDAENYFVLSVYRNIGAGADQWVIRFASRYGGTTIASLSDTWVNPPFDNSWAHIVATWNTTDQKLYINGVLNDTDNTAGHYFNNTMGIQYIGGAAGSNSLNASIDEVMIFNRSLSVDEIQQIYQATSNEKGFLVDVTYGGKRKPAQSLNLNVLIDRLANFFRTTTQTFSIEDFVDRVTIIVQRISTDYFRAIVNYVPSAVDRIVSFLRNPLETLNLSTLIDRIVSLFRKLSQAFDIETFIERIRSVIRFISQLIQLLISLFTKGTYVDWNWITSTETTKQGQAYEGVRVPFELNDNWTVKADSPQNWINVTKTYNLPVDCADVYIEIDGVNASDLINNTLCDYTVRNNKTLEPTNSSLINITYTTGATTSAEGSWVPSNKRIYAQTRWRNSLTLSNPTTNDYTNISINITTDKSAVPEIINVTNASDDVFPHTFDSTNGNVNWSLPLLEAGDDYVFTIDYATPNITLTKLNYTDTISGKEYEIYNISIATNSSRNIGSVYSYFNFSDTNIIANRFYKCSDGLNNCTEEITNRADVVFDDLNSDGNYDYVEWFITLLNQSQNYKLFNDKGYPIEITTSSKILNKPILVFDNVNWEITITMYNPNAFATEKVYKYEFPLGSMDVELDNVGKNLQYDPYGTLQPYITIVDKSDTSHLSSVYLAPGETKTFILTYRTSSVTVYPSTYFPSYFEVGEPALIVQTLRLKNQAEDTVEDIEDRIPINYAEDLIVCEGERKNGCIEDEDDPQYKNITLDTKKIVKGDYKLKIENMTAGETKYITLSYYTPTAKLENLEQGRRSIVGNLTAFKKYTFISQAHFTMDDLRYREPEVDCNNVVDILACNPSGICDVPIGYDCPLKIKLGSMGIGESKTIMLWYIEKEVPHKGLSWITLLWNWGHEFVLEKNSIGYYLLGWAGTTDEEGNKILYTGGLIVILFGIIIVISGLIMVVLWRKKIFIGEKT